MVFNTENNELEIWLLFLSTEERPNEGNFRKQLVKDQLQQAYKTQAKEKVEGKNKIGRRFPRNKLLKPKVEVGSEQQESLNKF